MTGLSLSLGATKGGASVSEVFTGGQGKATAVFAMTGRASYSFHSPLKEGVVVSRPNRFIMIVNARGKTIRCHCPTTGRLGDYELAGLPCLYSKSTNQKRATKYTVEAISATSTRSGEWIGINQTAANRFIEFFLRNGALSRMATGEVTREVKLGRSRIDFRVGNAFVEVKTPLITLPNSGTARRAKHNRFDSFGRLIKHMGELTRALGRGGRAIIVLCYLYDARPFKPPARNGTNTRILKAASDAEKAGVERWQVNLRVEKTGVSLVRYFSSPYSRNPSER